MIYSSQRHTDGIQNTGDWLLFTKISGIYQITCTANNKIYIGSSVNIKGRKHLHFSELRINNHHSKILQNSFNKYGEKVFTFEVLEYVPVEQLLDAEQIYLDLIFDPELFDQKKRCNICPIAGSSRGIKVSDETKKRISKSKKGVLKEEGLKFGGSYITQQYDLITGEVIANFDSTRQAARFTGLDHSHIASACRGKYMSSGGFGWRYI